ncbi:MAG: nucleotidyltransferase domain-containing protein [Prevotella sp.]|nr:nucleotidyltransferase domain-containing protein [Candidatus Prevotella equi]
MRKTETHRMNNVIKGIRDVASRIMPAGSKVLLYGSRARGDNRDDSDWDVLLLVNKPSVEQEDYRTIVYPITSFGWDINEMIIPIIKTKKEWEEDTCTNFHKNVEHDAITIL